MPPSAAIIARDQRILAGHAAGATVLDLAIAEEVDPAVVRRVLRPVSRRVRPANGADRAADRLADVAGLRAEYATKDVPRISRELGCGQDRAYAALHAAGVEMRQS